MFSFQQNTLKQSTKIIDPIVHPKAIKSDSKIFKFVPPILANIPVQNPVIVTGFASVKKKIL